MCKEQLRRSFNTTSVLNWFSYCPNGSQASAGQEEVAEVETLANSPLL